RREKATSNICTSQVLLALISAFYAMYHGPEGLREIARQIHDRSRRLGSALRTAGFQLDHDTFFDTLSVQVGDQQDVIYQRALDQKINLRKVGDDRLGFSLNETTSEQDAIELLQCFAADTRFGSDDTAL